MFTDRARKFTLSDPPLVMVPGVPDPSTGLGPPAKAKVTVPEVGILVASAPKMYGTGTENVLKVEGS